MPLYTYIWEYQVHPDHLESFLKTYHPKTGSWVELFRKAQGYCHTELLRDQSDPLRFITIDHWDSQASWEAFRKQFAFDFETIDAQGEGFTISEREIGRFESMGDD